MVLKSELFTCGIGDPNFLIFIFKLFIFTSFLNSLIWCVWSYPIVIISGLIFFTILKISPLLPNSVKSTYFIAETKIVLLFSLLIGFLLVVAYMIFKYKFLGLIANAALIINLLLLLGILTLLEATLTLPGIAGIILTVGMAVDANVLIFERIKEEMKTEKSSIYAFDMGYKNAQSAVVDANITTLISAAILYILGSGPVKGFAVTLGIGILTTLFSAYFFARHLSSLYVKNNKENKVSLWSKSF